MTTDEVRRVAELARLEFSESELEAFAQEFSKCVDYVSTIAAVDLSAVEPLASVNETVNVFRADVEGECLPTSEALKNAPKKNDAFFKVPKVLG